MPRDSLALVAVPTLSSVTPNTSRTGGRVLVRLTGTGFRLQATPPALGRPAPLAPSIEVRLGGVRALEAFAVSDVEAYALVPPRAAGVVAVTLQNLDDAGAPRAGELATLTGGFAYRMPDLAREGRLAVVVRALLQALKREVLSNVAMTTHTDYDPNTGDQLSIIDVGALPAIVLSGLRLPENRSYAQNQERTLAAEGGLFFRLRPARTVDVALTLTAATDHTVQMQNLAGELAAFFQRNAYLEVPDEVRGAVHYEMQADFGGFESTAKPSESNVRQFSGELVVRGVDLDEEDMRVGLGRAVADYVVDGAPVYAPEEASRMTAWPVILGSSANASVTPTNTPADGVDFEQLYPGEKP